MSKSILKNRWIENIIFPEGRKYLGVLLICLIVSASLGGATPYLINKLGLTYDDKEAFLSTLRSLLFLSIGVYINRYFYQVGVIKYIRLLVHRVRYQCYQKWLLVHDVKTGDRQHDDRFPQGEVLARIMNDTEAIRELITSGTFGIFIDLSFVFSSLIAFVTIDERMGYSLGGSKVLAVLLLIWGSRYMRKIFLAVREARGNLNRTCADLVGGVKETFYTKHLNYASKKGERVFDIFLSKQLHSNTWDASYYSVAESLYPILLAMMAIILPDDRIAFGAIILAMVDLIQRSIGPVKDIASKIANIQRAMTGFQRIDDFMADLDGRPHTEVARTQKAFTFERFICEVKKFTYPESQDQRTFALREISFEGSPGELIGIVGLSGSGKSTLLNLISGNLVGEGVRLTLIDKNSEPIFLEGYDPDTYLDYREKIGIVSQDSHLFSDTLRFNITMGLEQNQDEFNKFWEWVTSEIPYLCHWGYGPETILEQGSLSLGQKQLLAALRACYLQKSVVLFDEISSGLDGALEQALRRVVALVQSHSLTLIVAHRLETVRDANKILVLDQGELAALGRHDELKETSSLYRQFLDEISHGSNNSDKLDQSSLQ